MQGKKRKINKDEKGKKRREKERIPHLDGNTESLDHLISTSSNNMYSQHFLFWQQTNQLHCCLFFPFCHTEVHISEPASLFINDHCHMMRGEDDRRVGEKERCIRGLVDLNLIITIFLFCLFFCHSNDTNGRVGEDH